MKRDSDSLEVSDPGEGLSVSTAVSVQGLSSPPMKKKCVGVESTDGGSGPDPLTTSGLASPPAKSPVAYTTGGAEGSASPQPAAEAEDKETAAAEGSASVGGGVAGRQFPCVWLNGAGGVDTSPTKPMYDATPIVSFSTYSSELDCSTRTGEVYETRV